MVGRIDGVLKANGCYTAGSVRARSPLPRPAAPPFKIPMPTQAAGAAFGQRRHGPEHPADEIPRGAGRAEQKRNSADATLQGLACNFDAANECGGYQCWSLAWPPRARPSSPPGAAPSRVAPASRPAERLGLLLDAANERTASLVLVLAIPPRARPSFTARRSPPTVAPSLSAGEVLIPPNYRHRPRPGQGRQRPHRRVRAFFLPAFPGSDSPVHPCTPTLPCKARCSISAPAACPRAPPSCWPTAAAQNRRKLRPRLMRNTAAEAVATAGSPHLFHPRGRRRPCRPASGGKLAAG